MKETAAALAGPGEPGDEPEIDRLIHQLVFGSEPGPNLNMAPLRSIYQLLARPEAQEERAKEAARAEEARIARLDDLQSRAEAGDCSGPTRAQVYDLYEQARLAERRRNEELNEEQLARRMAAAGCPPGGASPGDTASAMTDPREKRQRKSREPEEGVKRPRRGSRGGGRKRKKKKTKRKKKKTKRKNKKTKRK